MAEFTPPAVPEGADLVGHVWTTRDAIQGWEARPLVFTKITLWYEARFILLTDPRLQRGLGLREPQRDSMFGMQILLDATKNDRTYTVTYLPR